MIKVYTEKTHYNKNYRNFLSDILRPFIPINNIEDYGLTKTRIKLVDDIINSDICLMPMAWNYYLKMDKVLEAYELIYKAEEAKKKIVIFVLGDFFISLPKFKHIVGWYSSPYSKITTSKIYCLPVIIGDPIKRLNLDSISIRQFNKVPLIGFCGQVDSNLIISFFKTIRLLYKTLLYSLNLNDKYSGPIVPSTYMRKFILDFLDKANRIQTKFIRRYRYQGGESNNRSNLDKLRKEFYQNINDTDYTLCIRGSGNFSTRFYETLALGRIPVFINTDCILPFKDVINWSEHIVYIEYNEVENIESIIYNFHQSLSKSEFIKMQRKNRILWEKYFKYSGFYKNFVCKLEKILIS